MSKEHVSEKSSKLAPKYSFPNDIGKRVARLIGIRKLIALAITIMFIVLSVQSASKMTTPIISSKLVEYVIISVIAFYFGRSTALDVPGDRKLKSESLLGEGEPTTETTSQGKEEKGDVTTEEEPVVKTGE